MSTFDAMRSDAEMQLKVNGFSITLWQPQFEWRTDEAEVAEDPFALQMLAALQCFLYFFISGTKRAWIHLAAEMQAGKTGVVTALLRLIFSNFNKLKITPERVFVLTGMNDTAWVKQTKLRVPYQVRSGVMHNGGLDKFVRAIKGLAEGASDKMLCNLLIVIDESQIASSTSNRPSKFIYEEVARLCPIELWESKNVRFLTISATDPAKVIAMESSLVPNKTVRLLTSEDYQSVEKLHVAGRIRYAEDFGDLDSDRAIQELKRAVDNFTVPLYHILRPRKGKHEVVTQRLQAAFPGCSVVPWDSISRPVTTGDDGSTGMLDDINDRLCEAPEVTTFIVLKNMFYASKTMDDTHVGVLYDRVGGKDDTNLQSLLGRACGYGKSVRTIIYTSKQTVTNYLQYWQDLIRGQPPPPTAIPIARLDRRMPYVRVGERHEARTTATHAAPGGVSAAAAEAVAAEAATRREANEDNFENTWQEFSTFDAAKAFCNRIRMPSQENGFYKSTLTTKPQVCRYDEIVAMQGGRKTAHMPSVVSLAVDRCLNRLYVGYRNIQDPTTVVFFVRRLKRLRAD